MLPRVASISDANTIPRPPFRSPLLSLKFTLTHTVVYTGARGGASCEERRAFCWCWRRHNRRKALLRLPAAGVTFQLLGENDEIRWNTKIRDVRSSDTTKSHRESHLASSSTSSQAYHDTLTYNNRSRGALTATSPGNIANRANKGAWEQITATKE